MNKVNHILALAEAQVSDIIVSIDLQLWLRDNAGTNQKSFLILLLKIQQYPSKFSYITCINCTENSSSIWCSIKEIDYPYLQYIYPSPTKVFLRSKCLHRHREWRMRQWLLHDSEWKSFPLGNLSHNSISHKKHTTSMIQNLQKEERIQPHKCLTGPMVP